LTRQIRQYEKEIHKSSLELGVLKDKLVSATRAYEDLLSKHKTEMHRLRRESKERDNKHRIELNILKSTLRETTQALEDCQIELQKTRGESHDLSENQVILKTKLDDAERKILR
jgi:chromosome segregation ATPase